MHRNCAQVNCWRLPAFGPVWGRPFGSGLWLEKRRTDSLTSGKASMWVQGRVCVWGGICDDAEAFLRPQEWVGDGRFWLKGWVDSGGSWMWHSGGRWSPQQQGQVQQVCFMGALLWQAGGQGASCEPLGSTEGPVLGWRARNIQQQRSVRLQRRGRWPNLQWIEFSVCCVSGLPLQKATTG